MNLANPAKTKGDSTTGIYGSFKFGRVSYSILTEHTMRGNASNLGTIIGTFKDSVLGTSNALGQGTLTRGTFGSASDARLLGGALLPFVGRLILTRVRNR